VCSTQHYKGGVDVKAWLVPARRTCQPMAVADLHMYVCKIPHTCCPPWHNMLTSEFHLQPNYQRFEAPTGKWCAAILPNSIVSHTLTVHCMEPAHPSALLAGSGCTAAAHKPASIAAGVTMCTTTPLLSSGSQPHQAVHNHTTHPRTIGSSIRLHDCCGYTHYTKPFDGKPHMTGPTSPHIHVSS
jgi:hypothetical protein